MMNCMRRFLRHEDFRQGKTKRKKKHRKNELVTNTFLCFFFLHFVILSFYPTIQSFDQIVCYFESPEKTRDKPYGNIYFWLTIIKTKNTKNAPHTYTRISVIWALKYSSRESAWYFLTILDVSSSRWRIYKKNFFFFLMER